MSETALCITYKQKIIYFGWSGACTKTYAKESLELDYSYKQILNIQPGTMVNVKPIKVSLGKMVSVEPLTIDDWEILELNASLLEDQFLNQIRVVYVDQVITIWISKAQIKLVVVKIDDGKKNVVCLNNESEIIVAPKQRKKVLKEEKVVMVSKAYPMEWTDLNIKDQLVLGNSLLDGTLVYVQNMDFNHLLLPITDNSIEAPNKLIKGIFLRVAVDSSVRNSVLDSATMQKINAVPMSRIKYFELM
jgi:outer membrane lipoprotein SlyB